jgi:predicted nucleic acid-binding protein
MARPPELLFDTTALIDIYRGKAGIKEKFDSILDGALLPYISVITEAELWRRLRAEDAERHKLILEEFILLPLDSDAARLAGVWMQKYSASGLGWMNALISATGKVAEISVLTRDERLAEVLSGETHFELYSA